MKIYVVYRIVCFVTGKSYIGQTCNYPSRKKNHFSNLRHNRHHNQYLQHACNKYGVKSLYIEILESDIPSDKVDDRERYWITEFDSFDNGYNLSSGGFAFKEQKGRPCSWNGIQYRTLSAAARANNVHLVTMKQRIDAGYTCDDDMPNTTKARLFTWNGIEYRTITEACKAIGIDSATMTYRLQRGYASDSDMEENGCIWNGVHYPSLKAAAQANNITASGMWRRLLRGKTCDADMQGKGNYIRKKLTVI